MKVTDSILQAHLGDNRSFRDFAILYRTNIQSRAIEETLRRQNVPYRVYAGISFYGRKEVKDALAYLRLVVNNYDDESLARIINLPARGIGSTSFDRIRLAAADNDVSIWTVMENLQSFGLGISSGVMGKIEEFMTMIKLHSSHIQDTDAYTLAKNIINASGLITMLRNDDDPDNANRIENIEELLNGIQEFCEREDNITPGEVESGEDTPRPSATPLQEGTTENENQNENSQLSTLNSQLKMLDMFLQQVLLLTSEDKDDDKDADKVSLMTIHAAKGLEFPYVYVVGMEENLFPSMLSINSRQDLEEERRLFYVAVTRAEIQLTLSYAQMRFQYGQTSYQELSRFVEEIDPHYLLMPRMQSSFPKPGTFGKFTSFHSHNVSHRETPASNVPSRRGVAEGQGVSHREPSKSNLKPLGPAVPNTPAQIAAIKVGMTVSHAKFGTGKVLSVTGDGDSRKAVVHFDGVGEKQLLLKFAKLAIIE